MQNIVMTEKPLKMQDKMESKYKILFVLSSVLGFKTVVPNLREAAMDCSWMKPYFVEIEEEWVRAQQAPVWANWNYSLKVAWAARKKILSASAGKNFDAVFYFCPQPALLTIRHFAQIPKLATLDLSSVLGNKLDEPSVLLKRVTAFIARFWWSQLYKRLTKVLPFSNWAASSLEADHRVPREKIHVWRPGYNLEKWKPKKHSRTGGEKVKILFIGNDLKRKGAFLLSELFIQHLSQKCELHIVTKSKGKLPQHPDIFIHRNLSHANDSGLIAMYNDCDIFAFPTLREPFGFVVAEAMCCGLPVVSTKAFAIPEMVRDGYNGFLVEIGDRIGLLNSLQRLVNDRQLREQMGQRSRSIAEKIFDGEKNLSELLQLIKNACLISRNMRGE